MIIIFINFRLFMSSADLHTQAPRPLYLRQAFGLGDCVHQLWRMVRETQLSVNDLIYPFVMEGEEKLRSTPCQVLPLFLGFIAEGSASSV